MRHIQKVLGFVFILIMLLTMCSCGGIAGSDNPLQISNFENGYFTTSGHKLHFVHESVGGHGCTGILLCAQPGCNHIDDTCQAWLKNVAMLEEHNGKIYAVQLAEESVWLTEKNLTTGKNRVISSWEYKSDGNTEYLYSGAGLKVSGDSVYLNIIETILALDGLELTQEETIVFLQIDIETGEQKVVFSEDESKGLCPINIHGDHMLVMYTPDNQVLMTKEEFFAEYGENASYNRYFRHATAQELRLYDLNDGTYVTIASDGLIDQIDPLANNGTLSLYYVEDDLYVFDMETLESRLLLTRENIVNFWILDGKAFIISKDGHYTDMSAPTRFHYASLEDGILVPFDEENTGDMTFGLCAETENCFIGVYNDSFYWITKEDFYADRYDRVY